MNLSKLAYQYKPVVLLAVLASMVFGAISFFTLPAQEDPSITIRESIVTANLPGLPADRVEDLITKPLEEAILTVAGVEEIRSTSADGYTIIKARAYQDTTDLDRIWDELQEAVETAHPRLPSGTSVPQVNDNFGDVAVATLALHGEDYSNQELFDFAEFAREQLNAVDGTKKIEIIGALEERVFIETTNARLAGAGLNPQDVRAALREQNIIASGGVLDTGDRAFTLIPSGEFKSVEEISNLLVRVPSDGTLLRLNDIADVSHGYADPARRSAYFNGQPAIILSVVMRDGQSALGYADRLDIGIQSLRSNLPVGLELDIVTWQAEQVAGAVYGVTSNVLQTLGIVLAVVILFLGLRTGLVVGSIVPAVVLVTLAVMGFFDMTLERMSLATIVIALGLLVDNGVVIAEDFKRRLAETGDRDRALKETGKELSIPLLSSSLTTILVFMPLMLAQHESGEYTRNISLVILITLLASWVLAMTVTPTLCHMFLKAPKPGEAADASRSGGIFGAVEFAYDRILRGILRIRFVFVIAMFALLPLGGMLVRTTPAKFFPDSDRAQVLIYVNLPAGVTTRTTQARLNDMMAIMLDEERYPELGDMAGYVGFGGPRFVLSLAPLDQAPHVGFIVVNAEDRAALDSVIPKLRNDFRAQVTDVEARVSAMFLGPSDPNVIQVQIKGPDKDYIFETSKQLEQILNSVPGTIDVWSDWYNPVTRYDIEIDQQLARTAGISSTDIASTLSNYVSSASDSLYRDGDDVYPIVSRAIADERSDPGRIGALSIFKRGSTESIPLGQVAQIEQRVGFPFIQREDLTPTVTVEARNLRLSPEDMAPMLKGPLADLDRTLPPGHTIEFDGIITDAAIGRAALFANFPLCIGLAVLLLVAQFNGYRRPLIVMMTIPLVVIGVGLGLRVMQADFGFLVILGLFALAGIIVNNAIVLIDRIDIERASGEHSDWDAVVTACVRRLRAIIITTITTIIGLLPLIIGRDVLFFGMASIMAFGLAVGTVLTLGVVPALYCLFFGIRPNKKPKTPQIEMDLIEEPAS